MDSLINKLRVLQADAFIFYTKAHGYHWNVEGILFDQFHSFFEELYQDLWDSVDTWAEWLRRLNEKASFDVMTALTTSNIKYDLGSDENNPIIMLQSLQSSNDQIISDLKECFALASSSDEQGAANFIAERIDAHEKWRWKFKASLTSMGVN